MYPTRNYTNQKKEQIAVTKQRLFRIPVFLLCFLLIQGVFVLPTNAQVNRIGLNCGTSKTFGEGNELSDGASDVAEDSQGNRYVVGSTNDYLDTVVKGGNAANSEDAFVAKIDPTGKCLWIRQYGTQKLTETGRSICVNADDDVIIAITEGDDVQVLGTAVRLIKYSANGIWQYEYGPIGGDFIGREYGDIAVGPLNEIYLVTTTRAVTPFRPSGILEKFIDTDTAIVPSWNTSVDAEFDTEEEIYFDGVDIGLDGFVYVSGTTNFDPDDNGEQIGDFDAIVFKFAATGGAYLDKIQLGIVGETTSGCVIATGADLLGNLMIAVAGTTSYLINQDSQIQHSDTVVFRLDANLDLVWSDQLTDEDGSVLTTNDVPNGISIDPSANIFVAGTAFDPFGNNNPGGILAMYEDNVLDGTLLELFNDCDGEGFGNDWGPVTGVSSRFDGKISVCGDIEPEPTDGFFRDFTWCLLGDVNQDGAVNLLDVEPFIDLLTSGGYQCEADVNEDGFVNLLDVEPFIDLVSGG